jgi:hypothetical protein
LRPLPSNRHAEVGASYARAHRSSTTPCSSAMRCSSRGCTAGSESRAKVRRARGPSGQSPRGREHVPAPRGIAGQGARGQMVNLFGRGKAERNACPGAQRLIGPLRQLLQFNQVFTDGRFLGKGAERRLETAHRDAPPAARAARPDAGGRRRGQRGRGRRERSSARQALARGSVRRRIDAKDRQLRPNSPDCPEQTQRSAAREAPAVNAKAGPAAKRRLCHRDATRDEQMPNGWRHLVDRVPRRALSNRAR